MAIFRNMQLGVNPIQNITHRRVLATLVGALAVSVSGATLLFSATSPAAAARLDCKPDLLVTNNKGASIKVIKFEYIVLGKSHEEGLSNKRLAPGETEEWNRVKLQHAAIGNQITSTRVWYKDDNSGSGSPIGDPYGPVRSSDWHTRTMDCADDLNYPHNVD